MTSGRNQSHEKMKGFLNFEKKNALYIYYGFAIYLYFLIFKVMTANSNKSEHQDYVYIYVPGCAAIVQQTRFL